MMVMTVAVSEGGDNKDGGGGVDGNVSSGGDGVGKAEMVAETSSDIDNRNK